MNGRVIGLDYKAWISASETFGYDKEMMTIFFKPIEESMIEATSRNSDGEE